MNPINGAIVVGVMILPLIASMSEDALEQYQMSCVKALGLRGNKD